MMDGDDCLPSLQLSEEESDSSDGEEELALHCPLCKAECSGQEFFRKHMIENHFAQADLACPICSENFDLIEDIENHVQKFHPEEDANDSPAEDQTDSSDSDDLPLGPNAPGPRNSLHLRKRYKCGACKAIYKDRSVFKRHLNLHKKNHKWCRICLEIFRTTANMIQHMKQDHRDLFTEFCNVCGKGFKQKSHLTRHQQETHENSTNFYCRKCKKNFQRKDYYDTHMKAHSTLKKYNCDICGSKFKQKSHLNTHLKIHNPVKEFICDFCGKEFTLRHHLEAHKNTYYH